MIDGGQGGEHGAAHGVGLDDFADGKFIGTFPDTGFRVWGNQTIAENKIFIRGYSQLVGCSLISYVLGEEV